MEALVTDEAEGSLHLYPSGRSWCNVSGGRGAYLGTCKGKCVGIAKRRKKIFSKPSLYLDRIRLSSQPVKYKTKMQECTTIRGCTIHRLNFTNSHFTDSDNV
jgi:hypothetical protein